ncbi:MAG: hypothetical protein UY04_C0005G0014 [Parcubacteria group bacterium GW2011_GWA2_47_7]|nr:MAG: hypothetical protein UY04_C0005G0014 [Parcubacteria group bacterium GW2011_GWA2_47_7]
MILATHAVVGAAAANIFPGHPMMAFVVGFLSHFVLDAIPHWHYTLLSSRHDHTDPMNSDIILNKDFPLDLFKIGCDAMLGIGLAVLFLHATTPYYLSVTILGAIGGIMPDALQFAYFKWRHEPLVTLQRFHHWIHAKSNLDHQAIWGPAIQVFIGVFCMLLVR